MDRENSQTFRNEATSRKPKSDPKEVFATDVQYETISIVDIYKIIELPPGEDVLEWLAYNVFDFHRQVTMLNSTIADFCTPELCPKMTAGSGFKYLWADGDEAPIDIPAPDYICRLLKKIENQLDDENVFPSNPDQPFPNNMITVIKNIMKRLFRVYAHFYYHHFEHCKALQIEKFLNTSFTHFILFSKKYDLISSGQLEPLRDLIMAIGK